MNYKKCDICNGFCDESELESVTIELQKHKGCKVDGLFMPNTAKAGVDMGSVTMKKVLTTNTIASEMDRIRDVNNE